MTERALFARVKRFLRPLKAHAKAKAERLVPAMVAACARPEVGVVVFRGAMAQTLLRQGPSRKVRALKKIVKGER
jgi:hypothetical protein